MKIIDIVSGEFKFKAKLEESLAPETCERFLTLLPYSQKVIHSRWSGEAVWIPLGESRQPEFGAQPQSSPGILEDVVDLDSGE